MYFNIHGPAARTTGSLSNPMGEVILDGISPNSHGIIPEAFYGRQQQQNEESIDRSADCCSNDSLNVSKGDGCCRGPALGEAKDQLALSRMQLSDNMSFAS